MTLLCFSQGKVREAAETSHRVKKLFGVLPESDSVVTMFNEFSS
jgi:hypothetical protein